MDHVVLIVSVSLAVVACVTVSVVNARAQAQAFREALAQKDRDVCRLIDRVLSMVDLSIAARHAETDSIAGVPSTRKVLTPTTPPDFDIHIPSVAPGEYGNPDPIG